MTMMWTSIINLFTRFVLIRVIEVNMDAINKTMGGIVIGVPPWWSDYDGRLYSQKKFIKLWEIDKKF